MSRRYDMRSRQKAAEETTSRILAAAHALLDDPGGGPLALQDVADAAGVTRATVYNRVGPRRALLAAVFRDQGRRIGYDRVLEAMEREDPCRAVLETVRESCRAWRVMPTAIRRTLALAATDAEVRELVTGFEASRVQRIEALVGRVDAVDALPDGLDIRAATAALTLLTSFPAFDALPADAAAQTLSEMAERVFGFR